MLKYLKGGADRNAKVATNEHSDGKIFQFVMDQHSAIIGGFKFEAQLALKIDETPLKAF